MQTLLEILNKTTQFFEQKGIESPKVNAELLIAHGLNCKRVDLYVQHDRPLTSQELAALRHLVKKRSQNQPLQYITGSTQFINLELKTTPDVLIPRPETEQLVEHIINIYSSGTKVVDFPTADPASSEPENSPKRILDLGTGSGAIALALSSHFKNADVTAADKSQAALNVAQENASLNKLNLEKIHFVHSDWFESISDKFDLIVSNPPYLTELEWQAAQPEVRDHEPKSALVAHDQGAQDLLHILEKAKDVLYPGGILALETGIKHAETLTKAAASLGYSVSEVLQDFNGYSRFFIAYL